MKGERESPRGKGEKDIPGQGSNTRSSKAARAHGNWGRIQKHAGIAGVMPALEAALRSSKKNNERREAWEQEGCRKSLPMQDLF